MQTLRQTASLFPADPDRLADDSGRLGNAPGLTPQHFRTVPRECLWRACTAGKNRRFKPLSRRPLPGDRFLGRAARVACHGQGGLVPVGCRSAGTGNPFEFPGDRWQPRCPRITA